MNKASLVFHAVYWATAYFFWLFFTQANHPTWTLRIVCTFVLVSASALYACSLVPRKLEWGRILMGLLYLTLVGLAAAILIQVIYDALLGPSPLRFKLIDNIWMDIVFVLVNTLMAAAVAWIVAQTTGLRVWRLRSDSTPTVG